ncbi:hypothetical protein ACLB2K_013421 [Fragaria x ananassa]
MDKSWMHADRRSKEFELGFEEFLKFAESNAVNIDKISCPCKKCCNVDGFSVEVVRDHVFYYGILESYKVWRWHGESMYDNGVESECESESESVNGDPGMGENDVEVGESEDEEMSEDSNEFLKFVEDGDQPLYNGCDHTTKMNFLVESFSWKAKHVVTDSCFGDFLELVKGLLPAENLVPLTTNDAKKTLSVLGMDYEKIHACPNDCILYRGDAVLVDSDEEEGVHIEEQAFDLPFVETYDDIEGDQDSNYMRPGDEKIYVMAGSSTSSLNARALALRTKTKEFLRKRGRSEVANEEASVGKAATPRRSPRSTKVVVVDQTSKDAPTKADVVLPRRSPRSTARTSKDALNNARVGPAKATQSKKSVASKKLSFGSMSNSGSGKRKAGKSKAGKSKAGTMEVVESDDEDEEFEADEDEEESNENVTGGMRLLRRGMVTMSRVNRRLVRGRKLKVKYNDDGEPVGRAAKEMQSYIGVFARTKVPINVKDWRLVPLSVKDNIWGSIELTCPSSLGVGNSTDRSRSFSAALKRGKPGQFFLVPYNTGKHWILSVVSPSEELVYFMDPMKRRMDVTTDEWRTIVNQYGIPEQIGDKSCGYFIMLYMREIVQDKEQNWTKKWLTRGDEKYTMQDVDVVRQEWAEYVLKFTSN